MSFNAELKVLTSKVCGSHASLRELDADLCEIMRLVTSKRNSMLVNRDTVRELCRGFIVKHYLRGSSSLDITLRMTVSHITSCLIETIYRELQLGDVEYKPVYADELISIKKLLTDKRKTCSLLESSLDGYHRDWCREHRVFEED